MADKIRKIQRSEVQAFLEECAESKPIVPVILDDTGLPRGEKGRKYVHALFSNPKRMGVRCVVSNNCKRFLRFVSEDEELKHKVKFVNIYLADGIHNTTDGKKECTIYIMPDYSVGNQLFDSFFRVFRKYVSQKKIGLIAWARNKWRLLLAILTVPVLGLVEMMYNFIEFLGEVENLKKLEEVISSFLKKLNSMNFGLSFVLAVSIVAVLACIIIQMAVRHADKACTQAVGKQGDNFVYFLPFAKRVHKGSFEQRWLNRNGLYREVEEEGKKKKFFYFGDRMTNLSSEDDVCPKEIFEFNGNGEDGYRFLLAVLEHYSSLEQEIKLKHRPGND